MVRHVAAPSRMMEQAKLTKQKSPRVSVTLSKDESAKLDVLSNTSKLPRSWLGRYAIRRLLDAYSSGQLDLPIPTDAEVNQ